MALLSLHRMPSELVMISLGKYFFNAYSSHSFHGTFPSLDQRQLFHLFPLSEYHLLNGSPFNLNPNPKIMCHVRVGKKNEKFCNNQFQQFCIQ
jgi:hypothetical protein